MKSHTDKDGRVRDLEKRFSLVEERFHSLVDQNKGLKARVAVLEAELARARSESQELEQLSGTKRELRERVENVLRSLDALSPKNEEAGS
jgi:chaperonin cofactor prefoldin